MSTRLMLRARCERVLMRECEVGSDFVVKEWSWSQKAILESAVQKVPVRKPVAQRGDFQEIPMLIVGSYVAVRLGRGIGVPRKISFARGRARKSAKPGGKVAHGVYRLRGLTCRTMGVTDLSPLMSLSFLQTLWNEHEVDVVCKM